MRQRVSSKTDLVCQGPRPSLRKQSQPQEAAMPFQGLSLRAALARSVSFQFASLRRSPSPFQIPNRRLAAMSAPHVRISQIASHLSSHDPRAEESDYAQRVKQVAAFISSERFQYVKRPYGAEDVVKLQGTVPAANVGAQVS
ncbi:hypothetical protein BBJ28_00018840, partial [Nothophytophthora sp. Chile5]